MRASALPEALAEEPWLRESYATHAFNVNGVYQRQAGWFDMNGTHLAPAPASLSVSCERIDDTCQAFRHRPCERL